MPGSPVWPGALAARSGSWPPAPNTQAAFGCYLPDLTQPVAHPARLIVLTPGPRQIRAVTQFLGNDLPRRSGLPATVTW
ncbi:hypothetical protein [Actinomadura rubrisoli]|uniref:Uncharacterized protein n=1 Tax=Actinomadura rubrisoli TaxID=2530368 RepID=A0A4R5AUY5_9ACTN|nr:hypothetical protein [Actinomadura rubrisoli]TDD76573.1 hypothetical protein E1298_30560 [Actinomadura rubrisoli]